MVFQIILSFLANIKVEIINISKSKENLYDFIFINGHDTAYQDLIAVQEYSIYSQFPSPVFPDHFTKEPSFANRIFIMPEKLTNQHRTLYRV